MSLSVYEIYNMIFMGVIGFVLGFCVIYTVVQIGFHLKRKDAINKYEIDLAYDASNIEETLDAIIMQSITDYVTKQLAFREDISYINDDLQTDIRNNVVIEVSKRMSPAFMSKLALVFDEAYISDIIADKIYMAVTAYVISNNAGKPPVANSDPNDTTNK